MALKLIRLPAAKATLLLSPLGLEERRRAER